MDYAIIQALRAKGFEIHSILEESPGIDDQHVLAIANRYKGLLITEDKDFGELTYRLNKRHHGILLIRLSGLPRVERINLVCELLFDHSEKLSQNFSVINEQGLRIKTK